MSNRSALMTTEPIKRQRLDVEIERLSQMQMGQVVRQAKGVPEIREEWSTASREQDVD